MIGWEYGNPNDKASVKVLSCTCLTGNYVGFVLVFGSCLSASAFSETHRDYHVGTRMLAAYLVDRKPGLRSCLGSCFMRQR